jgi:hypothetical protein
MHVGMCVRERERERDTKIHTQSSFQADTFGETVLMHAIKAGSKVSASLSHILHPTHEFHGQSACTWLLELKADITMRDKSFG